MLRISEIFICKLLVYFLRHFFLHDVSKLFLTGKVSIIKWKIKRNISKENKKCLKKEALERLRKYNFK